MGIFGESRNAFDGMIEKVTDEKNTNEDWGEIMSVCDRVGATKDGPKECLRALVRRLNNQDPHVVLQAIVVLDACVNNCGRHFLLEVASREFETDCNDMINIHPYIGPETKVKEDQPELLPEPQALQSSSSSFITDPFMGSSSAVETRYDKDGFYAFKNALLGERERQRRGQYH